MKKKITAILFTLSLFLFGIGSVFSADSPDKDPISNWMKEWKDPSNQMRPLQIIHSTPITEKRIARYRDRCGLGGFVVSVSGKNGYIRNKENWKEFVNSVQAAQKAGLRIWIYDELGWPSLGAGGVVLEKDPSLESLELVFDKEAKEKFHVRPSYEYTFASMDSLRTARRHPNPLDPKAVGKFLEVTHQQYRDELGPDLYHHVEAFFTDEPTMLGFSLLRIMSKEDREKYGITDPLDWSKKILPAVPWRADLEDQYKQRYGEDLRPHFESLFGGESDQDRAVRERFWKMIAEINTDTYFGGIRRFCETDNAGPRASGHTLAEEGVILNVPVDGNKLAALKQFQIPGQDLLTSNPASQFRGNWLTNAWPTSAACLIGQRLAMTEISDHIQRHQKPSKVANIDEMRATAGIMASWGITEFTLYYGIDCGKEFPFRNEISHRQYCDFVGRINAILRPASPIRKILLYYPIELLQEEYVPMAGKFDSNRVSKRMKSIAAAFGSAGWSLSMARVPVVIADDQTIQELIANGAKNNSKKSRTIRNDFDFSAIVYPAGVPKKNYKWNNKNLKEIYAEEDPAITVPNKVDSVLGDLAGSRLLLDPFIGNISCGVFEREGKRIFILTNANAKDKTGYHGKATLAGALNPNQIKDGKWTILDPETGSAGSVEMKNGSLPIKLGINKTILLISP
ncbi:MAG: hypothetical protein Q4G69_13270 [Planctomycetia bacterium]|nr:hypothetical protein [Planctomycetia bacterium]